VFGVSLLVGLTPSRRGAALHAVLGLCRLLERLTPTRSCERVGAPLEAP